MAKYTVVSMPGDGIGKIVLPEAVRVLDAVGFDAEYVHADIGWEFWINEGNPLPERTVELLAKHKLGLFGAITSKPKDQAARRAEARAAGQGLRLLQPHRRPCASASTWTSASGPAVPSPGNPLNFIRRTADGGFEEPKVDAVIFRQNTEGLYAGVEWTNPPQQVRDALATHPKFKAFADTPPRGAGDHHPRSSPATPAAASSRAAFEYAKKHGYKSVTVCEKPNVLRETSGMMEEVAGEVQKDYPDIQLWSTNIDAQMMWLTKNPEDYGVIVAGNMFGDIISDAFAGLVGGLGFAASGNIGDEVAVFEPTHGSAPKYAELDPPIVNPIAMILTAGDDARPRRRDGHGQADPRRRGRGRRRGQGADLRHDEAAGRARSPSHRARRPRIQMTDAVIAKL